ncbi:MAG TPA: hypothetical protein VIG64_06600 [Actinomycetota bacterium]|jgi:V8-like Glu-specific endopeptidase
MSRPRRVVVAAVLSLLLPASLLTAAHGRSLGSRDRRTSVRRLTPDRAHLRKYWTEARMRSAAPLDVLELSSAEHATATRAPERLAHSTLGPGSVPPTAPDGTVTIGTGPLGSPSPRTLAFPFSNGELSPSDYRVYPYSTIGRIFFTDPETGDNFACSGTAVTSANQSVVWTAGHCVHGGGSGESFYTNWIFVPSYIDRTGPAGTWPALELVAPSQWTQDRNLHFDMAAVVVATKGGQRLTSVTGGRGIQWNLPASQSFTAYGYPAAGRFDGDRIFYCVSGLAGNGNPEGPGPLTLAIGCDMTQGSSGGGWIVGGSFLNSDISYGIEGEPDVLFGPYFGDAAATIYERAARSTLPGPLPTETPPVEPPVTPPAPVPTETATAPPSETPPPSQGDTLAPRITDVVDKPDPFTPNGDGSRDRVKLLFSLSEPAAVTLTIFKPKGAPLGYLLNDVDAPQAGRYLAKWNGKVGTTVVRRGTYSYLIEAVDAAGNQGAARGTVTVRP